MPTRNGSYPTAEIDIINSHPYGLSGVFDIPEAEDEYLHAVLGANYKEYSRMQKDPHVRSKLERRIKAMLGRHIVVEHRAQSENLKKSDREAIEKAEKILEATDYKTLSSDLVMSGMLIGFSVARINWVAQDDLVLYTHEFVEQDRFTFVTANPKDLTIPTADNRKIKSLDEVITSRGYELRLLTKEHPMRGVRCPRDRFILYTFGGTKPWGLGLGYSIYPWWMFKQSAAKAMARQSNRAGFPDLAGKYPAEKVNPYSTDPLEKQRSLAILSELRAFLRKVSDGGAIATYPNDIEIEVIQSLAGQPITTQRTFIQICNDEISKAVIGEIPISDKDFGSRAANESQVDDRETSLTDDDCGLLDEQMDSALWAFVAKYNYPDAMPPIIRRERTSDQRKAAVETRELETRKLRAEGDRVLLKELGLQVDPEYIKENYGEAFKLPILEEAEEEQPLLQTLGVSGIQALTSFLGAYGGAGLTRENAIAVLVTGFGLSQKAAEAIVPEPVEEEPESLAGGEEAAEDPEAIEAALGGEATTEEEPVAEEAATEETTDLSEPDEGIAVPFLDLFAEPEPTEPWDADLLAAVKLFGFEDVAGDCPTIQIEFSEYERSLLQFDEQEFEVPAIDFCEAIASGQEVEFVSPFSIVSIIQALHQCYSMPSESIVSTLEVLSNG